MLAEKYVLLVCAGCVALKIRHHYKTLAVVILWDL